MRMSGSFLRAAGIAVAATAGVAWLPAQDVMRANFASCSAISSACLSSYKSSPSDPVKLADDYCNTRCEQKFNYCQYRGETHEHCAAWLATCRSRC